LIPARYTHSRMSRLFRVLSLPLLFLSGGLLAQDSDSADGQVAERRHRLFLEEVDLLIGDEEREGFLNLKQAYQRDRFIDRFWRLRDPFPQTTRNELRVRWQEHAVIARGRFDDLSDFRAQMILFFGEEKTNWRSFCSELLVPLEIWHFDYVAGLRPEFYLVLRRFGQRVEPWSPNDGLDRLQQPGRSSQLNPDLFLRRVRDECSRGDQLVSALLTTTDWRELATELRTLPEIHPEWVLSFLGRTTDLPEGAASLPAELSWDFPGAHQSRTVVQLMLSVNSDAAKLRTIAERSSFNFLVDGDVLRQGEFFESFRYKFDIPVSGAEEAARIERLPLAVQRYLRPGRYTWVVRLQDLNATTFFRDEIEIDVPNLRFVGEEGAEQASVKVGDLVLWDEANASLDESPLGDHSVTLRTPTDRLLTGIIRVLAESTGEDIHKVSFTLNGKEIIAKRRAPYSVEINLDRTPRMHTLAATAFDSDGRLLARDEVLLNAGPHRFAIRLVEPQRGHRYKNSVRTRAEVDLPATEILDRVEFYLNETLVATLYQEPFVQPILIPESQDLGFVRAVAYLVDGTSAEDLVFVNSPHPIDSVDVNLVELYASVFDSKGNPASGLSRDDFVVKEDGVEQHVRRFEEVQDRPLHTGILLDVSASMTNSMKEAEEAALRFFQSVIRESDRACLVLFSDEAELVVPFTNDVSVLAGGLVGIAADGETSLHDSLIFTLHYFNGLRGKRAFIVITDGADSNSEYKFSEVLEFARRSGVGIYTVGLNISPRENLVRTKLIQLARETGGNHYFIDSASGLERVYEKIESELRSQYLLAYQSSQTTDRESFRKIELKVKRKGLRAKTMRGYYP